MRDLTAVTPAGRMVRCPEVAVIVTVDVRDDLREGREPFARLMKAVDDLEPDQVLQVRAPFAPLPLIELLSERGFVYHAESDADDDWSVWFWIAG
jgi:Uncharacterized conserved protein (DUF2249)